MPNKYTFRYTTTLTVWKVSYSAYYSGTSRFFRGNEYLTSVTDSPPNLVLAAPLGGLICLAGALISILPATGIAPITGNKDTDKGLGYFFIAICVAFTAYSMYYYNNGWKITKAHSYDKLVTQVNELVDAKEGYSSADAEGGIGNSSTPLLP